MEKLTFKNSAGEVLSGRIDTPKEGRVKAYAIFAHCFTCNKNLSAVRNIAKSLNDKGIAVLRFDFTGLGESEGDFADTNFSSNVEDLISASNALEQQYEAPKLIIGHSLGGAAVIFASTKIPSIQAVATIGAPASPDHVSHLFEESISEIRERNEASVKIGGRDFTVKKQFLEDISSKNMKDTLKKMKEPLIIFHSPQDNTVGIENASAIYEHAMHPKSFVSLDGADHLLSNSEDSIYVGEVIASWSKRYLS